MAELEIACSYVLAFLGYAEIASELSRQIVVTVIGGIGFYCIKALIENLSKYGGLFGSNKEKTVDEAEGENQEEESSAETADEFAAENNVGIDDI